MDLYKKKSLKFDSVGLSGNLRVVERSTARAALRHSRFSLLRHLEDENEAEEVTEEKAENKEDSSRIPTLGTQGKPNLKAPMSRLEMLKKWKVEKEMKRQQELKTKKPTFKVGLLAPKPVPKLLPFEKSTNSTPSKSYSRLRTSADSRNKSNNQTNTVTETSVQQSSSIKAQTSLAKNVKSFSIKESKTQIPNQKLPVPSNTSRRLPVLGNSNQMLKQDSRTQATTKPLMISKNTSATTKEVSIKESRFQSATKSQMAPKNTSATIKEVSIKESRHQAAPKSQSVSKNTSATSKEVGIKMPSSTVAKTHSRILKPQQTISNGISRIGQTKAPEPKQSQSVSNIQQPNKSKTNLPKSSFVSNNQKKSSNIGKIPEKTVTAKQIKPTGIGLLPKVQVKNASKLGIPKRKEENITFRCELSHIEPAEEKSLPQKGFCFCPPNETSFSFLEDGGITAIFSKLGAGTARTSTPKRADIQKSTESGEISTNVSKDSPKTEVFESPKENSSLNDSYHLAEANFPDVEMEEKAASIPVDGKLKTPSVERDPEDLPIREKPEVDENMKVCEVSPETKLESANPVDGNLPCSEKNTLEDIVDKFPDIKKSDLCQKPNSVMNLLEDSLPVLKDSPLLKDAAPEVLKETEDKFSVLPKTEFYQKPNHVRNFLEDSLPVLKDSPLLKAAAPEVLEEREDKFPVATKTDLCQKTNLVGNFLEDSLPVLKDSPLLKAAALEFIPPKENDLFKKPYPVKLLEDSLPNFEEKCASLKTETTSEDSQHQKTDLLGDELPIKSESDKFEKEESCVSSDLLRKDLLTENLKAPAFGVNIPDGEPDSKDRSPLSPIKIQSNNSEPQKELTDGTSIIARRKTRSSDARTRSFRRSEMPALESISESTENSSTPVESQPKPRKSKKSIVPKDFTPRRSTRLARLSVTDSEEENLFNVRPSLCEMSPDFESESFNSKELTYDFDNLHLESGSSKEVEPAPHRPSTRKGKVSLLYTPPTKGRVSTLRKSIKGDLMSFSPDV